MAKQAGFPAAGEEIVGVDLAADEVVRRMVGPDEAAVDKGFPAEEIGAVLEAAGRADGGLASWA